MWWWFGCSPDDPPSVPEPTSSTAYLAPPTTLTAAYDRPVVEAALDDAIARIPALDADDAIAIYRGLRALGDDDCPPAYPYEGYEYWYAQCVAASGAVFSGYSYEYAYGGGGGYSYDALYIAGAIVDPDGHRLAATGVFERTEIRGATQSRDVVSLDGVFAWEGAGGEGTWIQDGLLPGLDILRSLEDGVHRFEVDGGIAGLPEPADTVEFTGVVFSDDDGCLEPTGTLSVRVETEWFDVVFDGEACDSCGAVGVRGIPVGEACLDFSAWAAWSP